MAEALLVRPCNPLHSTDCNEARWLDRCTIRLCADTFDAAVFDLVWILQYYPTHHSIGQSGYTSRDREKRCSGSVDKDSTCWSRSNDVWVMSPTRFLCAKVLARAQHFPLTHQTAATANLAHYNEPHGRPLYRTANHAFYGLLVAKIWSLEISDRTAASFVRCATRHKETTTTMLIYQATKHALFTS